MASKKYLLLAGFIALFSANSVKAQDGNSGMYRGGGYDVSDTSLIPEKDYLSKEIFLTTNMIFRLNLVTNGKSEFLVVY
ncbi:MAG: hypothetical protein IPI46_06860 [Bacteroidetes bacterium]|nr:hypothetical protein [Bacteroidota bacterium]